MTGARIGAALVVGAVALLAAIPHTAHAQTADSEFSRGLVALRSGQLAQAAEAFESSYRMQAKPETLLNLGVVRTRQGQLNRALRIFERYLTTADPTRDAANMRAVRSELSRLRATSTTLVLDVTPENARIRVDGVPHTPIEGVLLIPPGEHRLEIGAPGHKLYDQRVNMPAGRFALELALTPGVPGSGGLPPPPPTAPDGRAPGATPGTTPAGQGETAAAPGSGETAVGESDPDAGCLLGGNACFILMGVAGAPNVVGVGAALRIPDYLSIAADIQFLPTITVEGADVDARLMSAMLRTHPFANGFFAGMGFALQHIQATGSRPEATVTADLNVPAIAFGIGYGMEGDGIFLGIDLMLMVEVGDSVLELPDDDPRLQDPRLQDIAERLESEAQNAVDSFKDLLPFLFQVNLIRLGIAF